MGQEHLVLKEAQIVSMFVDKLKELGESRTRVCNKKDPTQVTSGCCKLFLEYGTVHIHKEFPAPPEIITVDWASHFCDYFIIKFGDEEVNFTFNRSAKESPWIMLEGDLEVALKLVHRLLIEAGPVPEGTTNCIDCDDVLLKEDIIDIVDGAVCSECYETRCEEHTLKQLNKEEGEG